MNGSTVIESKVIYSNRFLHVREDKIADQSGTRTFTVVERDNSVIVIPLSPRQETVLLRQYRHPINGFSWEFPMGGIDEDETPQDAARRELFEETSIRASHLELIGTYRAVPGLTPQQVFIFIAQVEEQEIVKGHTTIRTDDIQSSKVLPFVEIQEMARRGEIVDGFTLAGLLFTKLHLDYTGRKR